MNQPQSPAPANVSSNAGSNSRRTRAMLMVTAVVTLAAIAYGVYYAMVLSRVETTDNAYAQATIVQITPQLAGTVTQVLADDTDLVKPGQALVRFDPADALVALDQARAQLAQTVRETRTLYAANATFDTQIASRQAELARAQAELRRVLDDAARREPLLASGAVAREEYDHALAQAQALRSQVQAAQSALETARAQLAANRVLTDGIPVDRHPAVQRAASRVHEAQLALHRAQLVTPIGGYVARRNVQVGQRVQAGTALMSVVALDQVWVDANFKEGQLKNLRIGQSVKLQADLYGSKVEYNGKVDGLGAGTGAAFALLPAQNASGNWIKVVQRLPVRITLDPAELAAHPLRVGLSMRVSVDITRQEGASLAQSQRPAAPPPAAAAEDAARSAADALVRKIIAENRGQ
jgi:membrane fusion protein (multidrug efflux system)